MEKQIYYVVDKNNKVIARCGYRPDEGDLSSRQERCIPSESNIDLEFAQCVNEQIGQRDLTNREKADLVWEEKNKIDGLIDHHTRKQLKVLLEKNGLLSDQLKSLWEQRESLAEKEDILTEGQEDARKHKGGTENE